MSKSCDDQTKLYANSERRRRLGLQIAVGQQLQLCGLWTITVKFPDIFLIHYSAIPEISMWSILYLDFPIILNLYQFCHSSATEIKFPKIFYVSTPVFSVHSANFTSSCSDYHSRLLLFLLYKILCKSTDKKCQSSTGYEHILTATTWQIICSNPSLNLAYELKKQVIGFKKAHKSHRVKFFDIWTHHV